MEQGKRTKSKDCFLDCIILNSRVYLKYDNMMVSGATTLSFILLPSEHCKILKTYQRFSNNKYTYNIKVNGCFSGLWLNSYYKLTSTHAMAAVPSVAYVTEPKYTYPLYMSARITMKLCFRLGDLSPMLPEVCNYAKINFFKLFFFFFSLT